MHRPSTFLHNLIMDEGSVGAVAAGDEAGEVGTSSLIAGSNDEDHRYQVTRRRGAASWLVILTTGGTGWGRTSGPGVPLVPGRIALFAPEVPHAYGTDGSWQIAWAHFRAREWWRDLLRWPAASPGLAVLDLGLGDLHSCAVGLRAAEQALEDGGPLGDDLGLAHLETVVLVAARAGRTFGVGDPRVRAALDHLHRRVGDPFRADEVAAVMHLSAGQAARLFAAQTGSTPQRYATRLKMDRARRMLELSDLPVGVVARAVGFETETYFSRRFRIEVGVAPRVYRQQHRR